ncbi:MAG: DsbA family protein [Corynebacterium humireducens]|jgi:hypothetical protein|uniref:DsbA family protein n=1 Tax=Corynebacterium humireducens TaxID=1223514 RepID=A0A7X6PNY9_9CORY|nr:DsbA family protein [Corynebacterium humireducens]
MSNNNVTFWFDVTCPFAWLTSRWIREVEKVRDITVTWQPMSLSVLNEGRDLDPEYMAAMEAAWGPARVFTRVALEEPAEVGNLYTVMGTIIHAGKESGKKGERAYDGVIERALKEAGLSSIYATTAHSEQVDEEMRAFHAAAMDAVGDEVGTPVLKLGDTAFFGPVITRVPEGEEAGELFDAAVRLAQFPYFFELKRSRTENPQV